MASKISHAVHKYSAVTNKPTNPESGPSLANGKYPKPLAENQNPSLNSLWRTKRIGEKPAPSTNWRDRGQPRNESSAFSCRQSGANTREKNTNPFGDRRNKLGWSFSPASNGSVSAFPVGARKAFGFSRNKFGSNSSIASDCSNLSSVQPGDSLQSLSNSRKKFGSSWSVASESSSAVTGRSIGRGASYTRGNAASFNKSKTGRRVKPNCRSAEGLSEMSLEYLCTLSQKEVFEIVIEVTIDKSPFDVYLQKSPLEYDWLLLIMNIVTKICVSEYEGNRSALLNKVCDSPFFDNLSNYLEQMTVETNSKTVEKLVIHDLCEFFSSLLDAWSMVTVKKNLKTLINKMKVVVSNTSVLSVPIQEDILSKLETFINIFEEKQPAKKQMHSKVEKMANCAPPDDFRQLSLYPTPEDVFSTQRGFVRPNITKGAYKDVEHYLDVQFRLLREDFIDSVRSGIQKYLASKSEPRRKFKFDSIRIYPDTCLENWEQRSSSTQEVGIRLNFDPHERFARTCDWVQNKRFMHGSLLLLTADDFNTFTCATVMERDVASLRKGCVLAALVGETPDFHKIFAKPFTMAESEVFFEPYFHILEALKKLNDVSFPMPEYIVRGQSVTKCPLYPDEDIVWGLYFNSFQCNSYQNKNYRPVNDCGHMKDLDDTFWELVPDEDHRHFEHVEYEPTISNSFQLDEYQMEAYEAGMERDFCVIQGPPGTGKTFLGLKLVESILSECHKNGNKLPILVVCLTNHALDQFLERILAFTNKIVRVGGQSQSEKLMNHNLRTLRSALFWFLRTTDRNFESMTYIIKKEITKLSENIANLQKMKKYIETPVGVLSTILLKQVVDPIFLPVVENDETLLQWLLEDNECEAPAEEDFVDFGHLYENDTMDNENPEPMMTKKYKKNTSFTLKSICEVNCLKSYSITLGRLEEKLRRANEELNDLIENEDGLLKQGNNSSLIYFEKNYLKNQIKHMTRQYHKLKANLETNVENPDAKVFTTLHQDPRKLLSKSRWQIYLSWLSSVQKKLLLELSELETRHRTKVIQYDEYKMFEDLHIMKKADIVGMTTTGAARLSKLLALLKPAIVIVEEAAEVLEAHIVASLTKSCQHLILIGDHKQLRPSAAVYELSKYFNIDVSLFERMINNGMHCPMLRVQHRMRPEISALITPLIYPDLKNHESVMFLEPIEGVKKSLFFLEHNMPETVSFDDTSKENVHEAKFVVKLARYFVQQGYNPENITLLTLYAGQMIRIRNLMKSEKDDYLKDVKCVVVDKYQGEENYIIILSLVRSNEDGSIGFLGIENRVCVALSRAKNGFFMIGNIECLAKTQLWQKLSTTLEQNNAIGDELPLYCDRHDKITPVSKAEDFNLISDGGCGDVCNLMMECGHDCQKKCHPLLGNHESVDCEEPCLRRCPRNHACKKLCKEDCGKCVVLVKKILPCQHVALVRCHVAENQYLCSELVEDVLLSCEHVVKRKCHQTVEDVICMKPCKKMLRCGHTCTRLCHEDDPDHAECKKRCGKYYEGCKKAHLCEKSCYEKCGTCPIEENVTLSCGHELTLLCSTDLSSVKCKDSCLKICPQCNLKCMKKCWENCHPCINKVRKVIPACGHEIDVNCSDEPNQKLCQQNCKLMAPCGHKCQLMCGETCDSKDCKEWATSTARKPICGHENIYVLCSEKNTVSQKTPESFLANCREPCDAILECGDVCSGTCGQCLQGRLHQTCPNMCGRTFICGHKCKFPCRQLCPPCNEPCSFRCSHSNCTEKCGIPCSTCEKPCEWKCKHTKCGRKCGNICNRQPCNKPCELKLPCGHDCIGFCGEPCPPQCRVCNAEITNIIFGFEDAPDARFVLMVDCDHIIESRTLDQYFSPTFKNGEIVLRGCPLCGTPITKTLRYMNFVKRIYQQIAEVKAKHFEDLRSFDLKKTFLDWRMFPSQCSTIPLLFDFAEFCIKNIPNRTKKLTIFSSEMISNYIYLFQVCQALISPVRGLEVASTRSEFFRNHVILNLYQLTRRLQISFNVNRQLMLDFNLELRRYHLMLDYLCIYTNSLTHFERQDAEIPNICAEIRLILFGFSKFTQDDEDKIRSLFEKLRTRPMIASGSTWPKKQLITKKELPRISNDLNAGSWFQCLNGHYYCIDPKENMEDCPECVKKGTSVTNQSGRRRRRRGRR